MQKMAMGRPYNPLPARSDPPTASPSPTQLRGKDGITEIASSYQMVVILDETEMRKLNALAAKRGISTTQCIRDFIKMANADSGDWRHPMTPRKATP